MTAMALYQEAIRRFQGGNSLDESESEQLIAAILDRQLSEVQVAAILAGLAVKGEVATEIAGFARGMRRVAVALDHRQQGLVDTAGTGGDGAGTFNISTTAAFVIAGAGVPVAKHGNRAISGKCGSADVLAQLGVRIDAPRQVLKHSLETCGITFLFAPVFHQAMKVVAPLRRNLAMRTIFNLLGPLLNPAGARRQIIGVFAPHLTEVFAQVLQSLGCEHALIFSAEDGLDEISIAGPTRVTELKGGVHSDRQAAPRGPRVPEPVAGPGSGRGRCRERSDPAGSSGGRVHGRTTGNRSPERCRRRLRVGARGFASGRGGGGPPVPGSWVGAGQAGRPGGVLQPVRGNRCLGKRLD